jgi:hypothetical protein
MVSSFFGKRASSITRTWWCSRNMCFGLVGQASNGAGLVCCVVCERIFERGTTGAEYECKMVHGIYMQNIFLWKWSMFTSKLNPRSGF